MNTKKAINGLFEGDFSTCKTPKVSVPPFPDTTITNLFGVYTYEQPFGWEDVSASVIGGVSNEDSDINFHDVKSTYISTGVNYFF